jgi:hypothetical protein
MSVMKLFLNIACASCAEEIEERIQKMLRMVWDLGDYIRAEMMSALPLFTTSDSPAFTIGYCTTFLVEPVHRMVKGGLPGGVLSLVDLGAVIS